MYAIVEIGGKQFRAEKDKKLKVPLISVDKGNKVQFDRVLVLEDDEGKISIGTPVLKNNVVTAEVLEHGRDKKIIVFHKKRRKGYQKKNGHRQPYSIIQVMEIGVGKAVKAAPAKEEKAKAKTPAKTGTGTKKSTKASAPKKAAAGKKPAKGNAAATAKKTTSAAAPKKKVATKPAGKSKATPSAVKKSPAKKKSEDVSKKKEK
jgi:large subunit ribosomal protein L21